MPLYPHVLLCFVSVIYAQMARYPDRNIGCFGFFEQTVSKADVWNPIKDMFYPTMENAAYDELIAEIFHSKPSMTQSERDEFVPYGDAFMSSMQKAHDGMVDLCFQQNRHNKNDKDKAVSTDGKSVSTNG